MKRRLLRVVTALLLTLAAGAPASAQGPARDTDADRDRATAARTLDRGRRLGLIGGIGAGMGLAASFLSDERKTAGAGAALAVGGVTALGLGLIGDVVQYRSKTRLDALDRTSAGGPARAEAQRALRQGRRLALAGDVGASLLAASFFAPDGRLDTPAGRTFLVGAVAAVGAGIVGRIKARRAEERLAAFDVPSGANHRVGVAPLPDGFAASYALAW